MARFQVRGKQKIDYPGVTLEQLREAVGDRIRLIGSVPTVTHLLEGTREDIMAISLDMMRRGTDMLSPSCGLPQYTSLENVRAIAEAIEKWNSDRRTGG